MAAQLWLYWEGRFRISEGREWLAALLATQTSPSPARAKGLWAAGYLALLQSDVATALPLLEESRRLASQSGDHTALAYATQFLGFAALYQGNMPRAMSLMEEGLRLHRLAGNGPGVAGALLHLGMTRSFRATWRPPGACSKRASPSAGRRVTGGFALTRSSGSASSAGSRPITQRRPVARNRACA